jgi:hypothetical protein
MPPQWHTKKVTFHTLLFAQCITCCTHSNVYPKFQTCRKRKRKSKKRQWFPSRDDSQLVQVSSKKKQWFPSQEGAEVHEVDVNMQEQSANTHEVGVDELIVQVQLEEAALVQEVEQVDATPMSTPKKL